MSTSTHTVRPQGTPVAAPKSWPSIAEIERSVEAARARLDDDALARLRFILWEDLASEFDARFYSAYLPTLGLEFTPEFDRVQAVWADDERRHHAGFRAAYEVLFGAGDEQLASLDTRLPDFNGIAHLFGGEFEIICLGCYDELATVRAYQANLSYYARLGADFLRFVKRVIADEALHYRRFLELLKSHHAHRLAEVPEVVARIRSTEGTTYGNTFVLDHDDPVFTDSIFDAAAETLLRNARPARRRGA